MLNSAFTLAQSSSGGDGALGVAILIVQLIIIVVVFAGMWKVYVKAGQPGWAAIVPIYNMYVWTQIVGRPWWWLLLLFIPFINFIIIIILCNDLSKAFGRGLGTTLGLIFLSPIFIPILGFGSAQYQGPART